MSRYDTLTITGTLHDISLAKSWADPAHRLYSATLQTVRKSNKVDHLPCLLDDVHIPVDVLDDHTPYIIEGEVRTRAEYGEDRRHNRVYIWVTAVMPQVGEVDNTVNSVSIRGALCGKPVYADKADGRRVSTVIVRVPAQGPRGYYVPCVLWGQQAVDIAKHDRGHKVHITGRLQERAYSKKLSDGSTAYGTAYELSVQTCEEDRLCE